MLRVVLVAVVLSAAVFWLGVFLVCFTAQGTTAAEFFLGRYDALPPDLGEWRVVARGTAPPAARDAAPELLREERLLLPDGKANSSHLVYQVRYRDPSTREIVRVEPEELVRRRRVSARAS